MPDLHAARQNLDSIAAVCTNPALSLVHRMARRVAVIAAGNADRLGDEQDARRYCDALIAALRDAREAQDVGAIELYEAQLMAVLSGLADAGDEDAAMRLNALACDVPPLSARLALAVANERRGLGK